MTLSPSFHLQTSIHSFTRLQLHPRLLLLRCKSTKPCSNPIQTPQSSTANWIQNWSKTPPKPLSKPPKSVTDYRSAISDDDDELVGTSRSTNSSTMERIIDKLKKFGYIDEKTDQDRRRPVKGSVEDIFYSEDGILPDTRGRLTVDVEEARFPWEKVRGEERKKRSKSSVAELTLPEGELRRLRHLAIRIKSKVKIKGAGVTKEVVDLIHEKWGTEEVVRFKCEGTAALNMRRMHEILEVGCILRL